MTAARRAAFLDASRAAYNRLMAARRLNEPIEPMTLGNMRARAILKADPWPDDVPVPTFGPRMVCT